MAKKSKGKSAKRKHARRAPGPRPSITLEVVQRVSERYGMGIPLQDALAAEGSPTINLETWKKALAAHPELSPPYEAAKGKFLEFAMCKLRDHKNLKFLCFLLRTRRADLFSGSAGSNGHQGESSGNGIPDDVLERARQYAQPAGGKNGR